MAGVRAAVAVLVLLSAGVGAAQSLGDVARQDRERRETLTRRARVITNEDLKREKILPPPAESDSATATPPAPGPQVAPNVPLWEVASQPGFSLGAYARLLREWRAARQREMEWAQQNGVSQPAPAPASSAAAEILHLHPASGSLKETGASAPASNHRVPIDRPAPAPGPPLIRVARGDSLWKLARAHFGEGRLWKLLWESNPELRNPNLIYPGQLLRLPGEATVAQYRARRPAGRRVIARMWNTAVRSFTSRNTTTPVVRPGATAVSLAPQPSRKAAGAESHGLTRRLEAPGSASARIEPRRR